MAQKQYEMLTEGWSNTNYVVHHLHDSTIPCDWDGEPMGIIYSSENEEEIAHMVNQMNLNIGFI